MLSPLRGAAALARRGALGVGYQYASRTLPAPLVLGRSFSSFASGRSNQDNLVPCRKWHQVRFASTEGSAQQQPERKLSSLKSVLRRFYHLTHPDKFSEFPEAKLVNETSLRDFMAYMEDYKKHPRGYPGGRMRKIPLTFYVRDERDGEPSKELRKVTGELIANASNPHAAKRRISQLFAACGLDGDFTFEHDVWMPPETENLRDFLASALGHARESLKKASGHTTFVHSTLSNIERKHGVRIDMDTGDDAYWAPSENREVAEKLGRLFESLQADGWAEKGLMKGAELGLDSESETCAQDTSGKVYLSRKETVEEWEQYLRTLNWTIVHEMREKVQKTKNDEARAKALSEQARTTKQEDLVKILGVRTVEIKLYNSFECQFSGDAKQPHRPLRDDWNEEEAEDFEKEAHALLDRMLGSKQILQNKNSKFTKKLRNIALTFCPNMPADTNYHIDRVGELRVSTRITAKELMELLNDKIALMLDLQRTEQKFAAMRDFVEVRLGLKMLSVDYNYYHSQQDSIQHTNQALEKLQRLVEKLSALQLSGMTMAISDHYGLNLDGSLFIKWDFTDEEVVLLLEGMKEQDKKPENMEEPKKTEQTL